MEKEQEMLLLTGSELLVQEQIPYPLLGIIEARSPVVTDKLVPVGMVEVIVPA